MRLRHIFHGLTHRLNCSLSDFRPLPMRSITRLSHCLPSSVRCCVSSITSASIASVNIGGSVCWLLNAMTCARCWAVNFRRSVPRLAGGCPSWRVRQHRRCRSAQTAGAVRYWNTPFAFIGELLHTCRRLDLRIKCGAAFNGPSVISSALSPVTSPLH